jgi:hypothetical protein
MQNNNNNKLNQELRCMHVQFIKLQYKHKSKDEVNSWDLWKDMKMILIKWN